MAAAPKLAEPGKELRFTRAAQAAPLAIAGCVLLMLAAVLSLEALYRRDFPDLPHPAWGLAPFLAGAALLRLARRCVKHAYLILTPLGVEIFPFFRPETGMQMIPWSQIAAVEADGRRLTLHFTEEKSAGVHLSLSPIAPPQRELLARAMSGRFAGPAAAAG